MDDIVRSTEYIVCTAVHNFTTVHKFYYWLLNSRPARYAAEYLPDEESGDRQ